MVDLNQDFFADIPLTGAPTNQPSLVPQQQGQVDINNLFSDLPDEEADTTAGLFRTFLGQGVALGFGDEIEAFVRSRVNGTDYESELKDVRKEIDQFKKQNPNLAFGSELAGSFVSALVPGGAAIKGATLAGKVLRGAGAGAALGATQSFATGEGAEDRFTRAIQGAGVGGTIGAAIPGVTKVADKLASKASNLIKENVPAVAELRDQAKELFQRASQKGVRVKGDEIQLLGREVIRRLNNEGYEPKIHSDVSKVLRLLLDKARKRGTSFDELQNIRSTAKGLAQDKTNPQVANMFGGVSNTIDEFLENIKPSQVLIGKGKAVEAAQNIKDARALWRRYRNGEKIEELFRRAELSAQGFSSSGMENALRTEFRNLAKNKKAMRSFNAREKTAIEKVAKGGPLNNAARFFGKFAPTGALSFVLSSGFGGAVGGLQGAVALPALGFVGKELSTALTRKSATRASELVRRGAAAPRGRLPASVRRGIGSAVLAPTGQIAEALR